jgi:hypothetical protein
VLSREEIEGELRDVFAKMSSVELERELNGAWRELVEEELANRLEGSRLETGRLEAGRLEASRLEATRLEASRLEASRLEASRLEKTILEASRPVESLTTQDAPDELSVAFVDAAPPPPLKANWRSRIAEILRAVFKRKPH